MPLMMKYPVQEHNEDVIASFFEKTSGKMSTYSVDFTEEDSQQDIATEKSEFRIRLANTANRRGAASILINKMYSWRGYGNGNVSQINNPNRITLLASGPDDVAIGTISMGLHSSLGLYADTMYHDELEQLRRQGKIVCEYNRLAIDPEIKSKRVLASLFHIAYLYPYYLFGHTDGVLEVNPRHVRFYEKMMGFTQIGPERTCPRVNAPAVLLHTDFSYAREQIKKWGGLMDKARHERSLYPYFFDPTDEAGILGRLKAMT